MDDIDINDFVGKSCFYLISTCSTQNLYKFGHTKDIAGRMDNHRKTFGSIDIVMMIDMGICDSNGTTC